MATKDFNSKFKSRTFVNSKFKQNPFFNNLNLNAINNTSIISLSSITDSFDTRKCKSFSDEFMNQKANDKKFSSWKESSEIKKLHEWDHRTGTNMEKNSKNSYQNSSTISLNIAFYENSVAATSKNSFHGENKEVKDKKLNFGAIFPSPNPFEFPRQQENDQSKVPEVAQFKASQELLNPNTPKRKGGRPTGSLSRKTLSSDIRRENISQRYASSVIESMNEQQLFHYNLALKKSEKAESEVAELKNQLALLRTENAKALEVEKVKREMAERNYETEKVKREMAERNCEAEKVKREMAERNCEREVEKIKFAECALEKENAKQKKNIEKLQNKIKKESDIKNEMCKILNEKADEAKTLLNCYEKLKAASSEVLQNNRSLKLEISEAEENARTIKSEKEKLLLDLTKAVENSENVKRKIPQKYKHRRKNGSRYIPYELSAARTRRRKVQNAVQELKAVPDMAEKVLSRFKTKTEAIKRKINPLQAVTMAATIGLNCNQMENMKTFLRFFDIDVLPPVHKMRETLKMLKEEFEYEEFENIELGVVGRRVPDIREVVAKRGKRLMENQKWVDVPGLETFAFVGLTCDSGGSFLHAAISMMNVDECWGSPNNATLVATGKVPKENYETVECVCGKSFHQINQLDRTEIEFEVNGITVTKTVIVIVCFDGKMSSICSGHCGSSSAMPCYDCVSTKKDINEGKIGELRNAETMLRQAKQFEEKKKVLKNPSEAVLSKLRYECECITKRPLLTTSHTQWIYGVLHAAMGPVIKVLDTIEDDALKKDLKDLKINIQSSSEIRKSNKNLKIEIENLKSHIEELKNAIKTSKIILPKWKKIRRTPMKDLPICESPYCVQSLFGTDQSSLFLTFLKCNCGSFIHASCDLLFANYEIQYAQDTEYLCPSCDPISTEGALNDLEARQAEWEKDLTELKEIIKKKEQELKDTKVDIPYERCVTYQKIQSQLKELKVRKNLYFQKLNGVDVRKLITCRETFISVIKEDFQEDVRSLFACLNTFQELAEKQFLTDADIDMIDSAELKRAYKAICGDEITLKIHHLCDHTPSFMKMFHFYQLVNDHAIEHVHRICNVLLQKMCINKEQPQKSLKAITDHFCLRNKLYDNGVNISNLRTLSLDEKQQLINNLII